MNEWEEFCTDIQRFSLDTTSLSQAALEIENLLGHRVTLIGLRRLV